MTLSRKEQDQGFTLVELLITLSIVIILALVAIPTFRDIYIRYQLSNMALRLQNALQYARSEAIKNNTTVYAVFQPGTNWCYGFNAGASCSCNSTNCGLGYQAGPSAQDIQLTLTGMASNSIQIDGAHGATNTSSTVTFTQTGQSTAITVKIGALGNITLCSATISGYPACS